MMQQQRSSELHNSEQQVTQQLSIFLVPLSALNLLYN